MVLELVTLKQEQEKINKKIKKLRKGGYEYQSNINLQWLCLLISFSFQFSFVPIFINELKPWSNTCKSDALVWGFDLVFDVT